MKKHFPLSAAVFLLFLLMVMPGEMTPTQASSGADKKASGAVVQVLPLTTSRVIVALNVAVRPEGTLSSAQVLSQHEAIQQAQQQVAALLQGSNAQVDVTFQTIPYMTLDADSAALQKLTASGLVRQIIKESVLGPLAGENITHIGAPNAWAEGYDGTNQTVAILDTGVDSTHSFLTGKVVSEGCYSLSGGTNSSFCPNGHTSQTGAGSGTPCPLDYCYHGTQVAGIAAGLGGRFQRRSEKCPYHRHTGFSQRFEFLGLSELWLPECALPADR